MPLMDWDSFRQQAGEQSRNMNAMPFVDDPAKNSQDPRLNYMNLYGKGTPQAGDPGALSKVIEQYFRDHLGREPNAADIKAWLGQAANEGNNAAELQARLASSGTYVGPPNTGAPPAPGDPAQGTYPVNSPNVAGPQNPGSATPTFSTGLMSTYGTPVPSQAPGGIQLPAQMVNGSYF